MNDRATGEVTGGNPVWRGNGHRDPSAVVLNLGNTLTERLLVTDWVEEQQPGGVIADASAPFVDLLRNADTPVLPVRVTWVPREGRNIRGAQWHDLLGHIMPARPRSLLQRAIARGAPEKARVVVGDPATVGELRQRFDIEEQGDDAAFAAFVIRSATLACDRAERQLVGDRYKVPRLVADQITASSRFRGKIDELATRLGKPAVELLAEASERLTELAAVQSPLAIDVFRMVLAPLHAAAWDVRVDTAMLCRLRELNRRYPLVFLPAHRSYADPLVLAEVLHAHDFPRNHLLGGNNMAFWPIGPLGKRAGVVFIRRKNTDDQVYRLALREYLGHLVAKRFNLEWYIEGGRSRTGKLRPPKVGLLAYLAQALTDGRAEDVQLVPVSIVYDQLQEAGSLAAEQGDVTKRTEGLGWLARYLRGQMRNNGNARVRFGEPFSLASAMSSAGEDRAQLDKVAFQICDGINRATPVTATALVTLALLGTRDRALTVREVSLVVEPVLDYLERRDIPGPDAELRHGSTLRTTLDKLVDVGVAGRYNGGTDQVWSISKGQHRVAAFYRNGALHHFITRAVAELVLLYTVNNSADVVDSDDLFGGVWVEAQRLQDLLKFEFFFPTRSQFRDDVAAELDVLDPEWSKRASGDKGAAEVLASSGFLVAHRALRPFLDAQLVVATKLVNIDPNVPIDKTAFLDDCLGLGWQMLLQRKLYRIDSVSRELYANALRLAEHRGLTEPDGKVTRRDFFEEVTEVLDRLSQIGRLDDEILEQKLR